MSFSKMTISKRIMIGYSIFLAIFLIIGIYSVIKNLVSLESADTLDAYNKLDVHVSDSMELFLNAYGGAREMTVTKTYDDNTYSSILKNLDDSLGHMDEFLSTAKERGVTELTDLANEIIDGIENYKDIVVSKYELDRKRIDSQGKLFDLGLELRDSFEMALMIVSTAMAEQAASMTVTETPTLEQIMDPMTTMHRLNMIVYSFVDVRIAVRNILFLDDASGYDAIKEILDQIVADMTSYQRDIQAAAGFDFDGLRSQLALYEEYLDEYKELTEAGNILSNDMNNEYLSIQNKNRDMGVLTLQNLNEIVSEILSSSNVGVYSTIAIALLALAINIIFLVIIRRSINSDLMKSVQSMAETSAGIHTASQHLTDASDKLARGTTQQAASIEETSATMNETASIINRNNQSTQQAVHLSQVTSEASEDGVRQVSEMISFMNTLNESSDKIGKIISDINTIASQTTILALNASIEAVRAGEMGKSFSVVAEEVKNLAQQITDAAKSTTIIIEENIRLTRQGSDISRGVGSTLEAICGDAKKVSELLKEISDASMEQVQGVEQINMAMSQIEKVTLSNSSVSEESSATADSLRDQSDRLQTIMQGVKNLVGNV